MKLLNIGCGSSFHPEWTNIDLVSSSPNVQSHDVRKGLPYPDRYFDACYSSHVLEHHIQTDAKNLVSECFRVLKPQGVIRIVVPDLESIVKSYLHTLEQVEAGVVEAEPNYDWMILELLDQLVRSSRGGEMFNYLSNPASINKSFVKSRIGWEAEQCWVKEEKTIWHKIKSKSLLSMLQKLSISLAKNLVIVSAGREVKQAFDEGLFRNSGEIHRWMYDRFSLRRLLKEVGFKDVSVCQFDGSRIPNFNTYGLDAAEGVARKPDSLFIEGVKP